MKYWFALCIATVLLLASCEKKQPMQPDEELFKELYDLQEMVLDSATVKSGKISPNWARLSRNPVGGYRGYTGQTLLKYTSFGDLVNTPGEWVRSIELVVPVAYDIQDTTTETTTTVSVHPFNQDWDEESETIDWADFGLAIDSVDFPGPVDSTAYDPMRFDIDSTLFNSWMDTSETNGGILLQGSSDELMLYLNSRSVQTPPYLYVTVIDTVPDTTHYTIYPQEDYANLTGGNLPQGSNEEVVLQQAYGNRMTLRWDGILDSLKNKKAYIHSAELLMRFDPGNSASDFDNHSIVITQEAAAEADSFQASAAYNPLVRSVGGSDSTLVIGTSRSSNFLRQYVQRIVTSDSVNTPLLLGYSAEGVGLKHLTVLPYQSKLRLVYSEVQ